MGAANQLAVQRSMLGEPRIGLKPLAALCRRMAMSLGAGVDVRTVWLREAGAARGPAQRRFLSVSDAVADGRAISDGLAETGEYFPEFFRQLVAVGESTGHLPEVFRQLSEHYEHQLQMRRAFVSSITWPAIELTMALTVVGVVIWLTGAIPALAKSGVDLAGLGLRGNSGLVIYLMVLGMIGFAGFMFYRAAERGKLWVTPVQRFMMRIPQLGRALETMAMSRLAWAMFVTLNSGMNLKPALRMSLASTHNALYTRHTDQVLTAIGAGQEVHEALSATQAFPVHFLDAVRVGEETGQLVESMENVSGQYQEEARMAMNTIAKLMGVGVFLLVACIIGFFIFQMFSIYMGAINEANPFIKHKR
jgi:type II secretory pathway component PulF